MGNKNKKYKITKAVFYNFENGFDCHVCYQIVLKKTHLSGFEDESLARRFIDKYLNKN